MPAPSQQLRYHGTGGTLFGIVFLNALLTIVSLGIYSFWAKTKVRQYQYSETDLAGDRFAYHGTGGELFMGALKAGAVLLGLSVLVSLLMTLAGPGDPAAPPSGGQQFIVLLFPLSLAVLLPLAINGARRYRLSRSSWRGIRFGFTGRWTAYLRVVVRGGLLSIISLGFYLPFFQNERRAFFANHVRLGSLQFRYQADGRRLFRAYLKALLLTLPTLGFSWVWYAAARHRYFWGHTRAGSATFRSSMTGGGLLSLGLTNLLLVALTLGIGTPWAMTRVMQFTCDCLTLHGTVDWSAVEQQAQLAGATAEGLAEGMDLDVDIGLGL